MYASDHLLSAAAVAFCLCDPERPRVSKHIGTTAAAANILVQAEMHVRLKRTNLLVERLSLNRSQCGGCSTKYDTPTES